MDFMDRFRPRARTKSQLPAPVLSEDILQPNAPLSLEIPTSFLDLNEREIELGRGYGPVPNQQSEKLSRQTQHGAKLERSDWHGGQIYRAPAKLRDRGPTTSCMPADIQAPPARDRTEPTRSGKPDPLRASPPGYEKGMPSQPSPQDKKRTRLSEPFKSVCPLCGKVTTSYSECNSATENGQSMACKGCEVKKWINPRSLSEQPQPERSTNEPTDAKENPDAKDHNYTPGQARCGRCGRLKVSNSVPSTAVITTGTKATPKLVEQGQLKSKNDCTHTVSPFVVGTVQLSNDNKSNDISHTSLSKGDTWVSNSPTTLYRFDSMHGRSSSSVQQQEKNIQGQNQSMFENPVDRNTGISEYEAVAPYNRATQDAFVTSGARVQMNEDRPNNSDYEAALSRFKSLRVASRL